MIAIVIIAAFTVVAIAFLINAVKIVRPYQRGLVERLGRYKTTKEPGFNIIIPFIETMQLVDMREQVVDVPPQEVITSDNVVVSVDAVVYYEATDPQRLIYNVANFFLAITKLAQTNLRNLIGDLELDTALDLARPHQHPAARGPRRRHRQVGCSRRARRDPAHRPTAGGGVGDARADARRARPAGHGHRGPRLPGGDHRSGRRREAVAHPGRRGTQAGGDPRGRGRRPGDHAARQRREAAPRADRPGRRSRGARPPDRYQGGEDRIPTCSPSSTSPHSSASATGGRRSWSSPPSSPGC